MGECLHYSKIQLAQPMQMSVSTVYKRAGGAFLHLMTESRRKSRFCGCRRFYVGMNA